MVALVVQMRAEAGGGGGGGGFIISTCIVLN